METLQNIFKYIGIIVCCILLFSVSVLCCYGGFLMWTMTPKKTPIEEISLDNNQTIKIWYETDIQHPDPSIYYQIVQANEVIVPETMIMVDNLYRSSYEYEIQIAFAQGKTLVCVYDSKYWDKGLLILYNTQIGKSWPNWSFSEYWRVPYAQLRDENPSLPVRSFDGR